MFRSVFVGGITDLSARPSWQNRGGTGDNPTSGTGSSTRFFAHTAPKGRPWEPLHEHLQLVATRASGFAEYFGAGTEAYLAGLLHDLGKYGEKFQRRLRGLESGIDHWTLGGWAALKAARPSGWAAALAIEGHHVGLQSGTRSRSGVERFDPALFAQYHREGVSTAEADLQRALDRLAGDGLEIPQLQDSVWSPTTPELRGLLGVRMLFSALVDADYVETEAFFSADSSGSRRYRPGGSVLDPSVAFEALHAHLKAITADTSASHDVKGMRTSLLQNCLAAADRAQGAFTMTAPTGSGKTPSRSHTRGVTI